ncbi:hypothetical protein D918_03250 [Trichuris suis]|nr:hypothetical protein D918_03250 [Trichuris suis]
MAAGQSTEAVANDLSLDERRRERRRLKIRHTNMVKEIDAHIRSSLSRSKLVSLVTELNSLTDLCLQCNDSMRSLITTDDDLEGITKWGENLLSIAAACREPVDHHLLQRADNVSSVISSRSSAAAARYIADERLWRSNWNVSS